MGEPRRRLCQRAGYSDRRLGGHWAESLWEMRRPRRLEGLEKPLRGVAGADGQCNAIRWRRGELSKLVAGKRLSCKSIIRGPPRIEAPVLHAATYRLLVARITMSYLECRLLGKKSKSCIEPAPSMARQGMKVQGPQHPCTPG